MQSFDPNQLATLIQALMDPASASLMAAKKAPNPNTVTSQPIVNKPSGSPQKPAWAKRMPTNGTDAARQMSMNAGMLGMPGGQVGAVRLPPVGSDAKPTMAFDPFHYGMSPNYGEATFFQQNMRGGVSPISAIAPIGVPKNWNPGVAPKPAKGGGGKDPKPGDKDPGKKPTGGDKPAGGGKVSEGGSKFNPPNYRNY